MDKVKLNCCDSLKSCLLHEPLLYLSLLQSFCLFLLFSWSIVEVHDQSFYLLLSIKLVRTCCLPTLDNKCSSVPSCNISFCKLDYCKMRLSLFFLESMELLSTRHTIIVLYLEYSLYLFQKLLDFRKGCTKILKQVFLQWRWVLFRLVFRALAVSPALFLLVEIIHKPPNEDNLVYVNPKIWSVQVSC